MTSVREFYDEKVVLITGVTGFVGKFLLEKLLRVCNPSKVYVLIRAKKGLSSDERLDQFLKEPVFGFKLQQEKLKKVVAVNGDVEDARVILNNKDVHKLIDEVQIVIHSAANVKFNETYEEAFRANVAGTNNVLGFCRQMTKLQVFVYVSTYASQIHREKILENIDSVIPGLEKEIATKGTSDIAWLEKFCKPYSEKEVTTYTFTKNIAESLVKVTAEQAGFPAVIVRPPILYPPIKEPEPCFTDDPRQGIIALSQSVYVGLSKVFIYDGSQKFVYNCVDVLVNAVLTSAWDVASKGGKGVTIFNVCKMGPTFDEVIVHGVAASKTAPSMYTLRPVKNFKCVDDTIGARIKRFFCHWLFAHIMDIVIKLSGHKPMLARAVSKLHRFQKLGSKVLFGTGSEFECRNLETLNSNMSDEEREIFYLDSEPLDQDYYNRGALSLRKYIMKEDEKTIPAAKRRLKRMEYFCNGCFYLLLVLLIGVSVALGYVLLARLH